MSKTEKQGRPRKISTKTRIQHKREQWRKASKKYYDKKRKEKKSQKKNKK